MDENYQGLQFDEIKQRISQYCSFSLGKEKLLASKPSFNRLVVQLVNNRLKQAINMAVSYGPMPFGGIYDITSEVLLAQKNAVLNPNELLKVASQAYGIKQIYDYTSACKCEKEEIGNLVNSLVSFEKTSSAIYKCINNSGELYDNASSTLASIRKKIRTLQSSIASKYNQFIQKNSSILQDSIIANRNGRNVVLVKNVYKNSVEGLQYGNSHSNNATYVEPSQFVGINNELQQAYVNEENEIKRILFSLSQLVKQDSAGYLANVETLALLDSIFACGLYAKANDATVGQLSEKDFILKKARHPLIDSSKVVSNDYSIKDPIKMVLITGANTGGKTVSLKIFALFSLMFLSGLPLLCDEAYIPLFDGIYYDIGDGQSIDDDLSTFSSHIRNISNIISKASSKSLVIFDELGSSTDPNDGQALAASVLDYCRKKGIYVVATTHFAKLKAYGKQYDDIMVASVEFDNDNLKPTYRYIENSIGNSNALEIARRYGLNQQIIEQAYSFKQANSTKEDLLMEKLQQQLNDIVLKQDTIAQLQLQLTAQKELLDKKIAEIEKSKEQILEQAKEQSQQIVLNAYSQSEQLIDKLKQMENYNINDVAKIKHQINQLVDDNMLDDQIDYDNEEITVDDYVRVKTTNQIGQVISIDKKNATIICQGVKMKVALASLVKTNKPKEKKTVSTRSRVARKSFSIECNLIGLRVDEALEKLDKYLDDALLANVPFVRIIHGVGTGALRNAVWDKLKRCRFVKSYQHGTAQEGSTGATIVYFKEKNNA